MRWIKLDATHWQADNGLHRYIVRADTVLRNGTACIRYCTSFQADMRSNLIGAEYATLGAAINAANVHAKG